MSVFKKKGRAGSGGASAFYSRRIYQELPIPNEIKKYRENKISDEIINTIICHTSEKMHEIPDESVHLVITSPPYNVGKEYDRDMTLEEYREFLRRVWREVWRVLVVGGRLCVNIANVGRKPYIPLSAYITQDLINIGFLMRGMVVWDKGSGGLSSTAWGSWLSAKNPVLRDTHEYILIFSKGSFSRQGRGISTITRDEFLEFTRSVWRVRPESARRVGHPAPFPIEIPYRLIQLYSFKGDVVLDPFMGSGTTALAALKTGRNFIGYEINEEYVGIARKRIEKLRNNEGC